MSENKTFGFGIRALKRFPELAPMFLIMGGTVAGIGGFIIYSLITKTDFQAFKSSGVPSYERIAPTESRKMRTIRKDLYQPIPELEDLRKELGSFKAK